MDRYDPYTDSFIVDISNIDQFHVRTVQLVELTDECIEKIVNKIAEAKPVVRGEWKVVDASEPRRYGCSNCKILSWDTYNYCSNCGAKMDEREDEDDGR